MDGGKKVFKENENPLVSIVIPVYNGSDYLKEAIDSALAQTYKNIEVLVINDGSKDDGATEQIALSYGDRIRYFSKENGGVASALNMGIEQMHGEYFSWLSHDDLYLPEKVERQIEHLMKCEDKTTIMAGGYTLFRAEDGVQFYSVEPHLRYTKEQLAVPLNLIFKAILNGCTMLIHKSHFERVGLFDESLPTTQDYDLWFRMLRGQKIIFQKGTYVKSRCHDQQGSRQGNHIAECSRLWIRMMDAVTADECIAMEGSVAGFYYSVYEVLKRETQYVDAIEHAKEKAIEEIKRKRKNHEHVQVEWLELLSHTPACLVRFKSLVKKAFSIAKEDGIFAVIRKIKKHLIDNESR